MVGKRWHFLHIQVAICIDNKVNTNIYAVIFYMHDKDHMCVIGTLGLCYKNPALRDLP